MTKETILAIGRRTGLTTHATTNQIKNAPQNALYVWPSGNFNYVSALARHLGRTDLQIVSSNYAFHGGFLLSWGGPVVFDHAFRPNAEQRQVLIDLTRRKAAQS